MRSRKNVRKSVFVQRSMISASTQCADVGWYSKREPGSQLQRQLAKRSRRRSRSSHSSGPNGARGKPDVCSITCSTVIDSFPFAANSGMYAATGNVMSTSPSPIRIHIAPATTAFVAENMT